ncbi:hypothetical protein N7522_005065 [Penicillium canescens]|nr:hypothetical protein N7522_005065 [Penicillium canescens]
MSARSEAVPRGNKATGVVEKAGSPDVRNKLLDLSESVIRADAPIAAASRDFQNFQTPSIPPKLHLAKFTIPRVPEQAFPGGRIGRAEPHSLPEGTAGRCVANVDKRVHLESHPGLPGEATRPKGIDRPSEDIHKDVTRPFYEPRTVNHTVRTPSPNFSRPNGRQSPEMMIGERTDWTSSQVVTPRLAEPEHDLVKAGKQKRRMQKNAVQVSQLSINTFLIFAVWRWAAYFYVFIPFVALALVLNCIMVFSILVFTVKHKFLLPEERELPARPETIVYLLPCYNETREELTKSLDSLARQREIEGHKRSLIIICDGKVRGEGMQKTTADTLSQDILVIRTFRRRITAAYLAWDQQEMDITIQKGTYKDLPYIAILKDFNQGKRDALILARTFLYNFNIRAENPQTRLSQSLFSELSSFLINDCGIKKVCCLVGMDADTYFDELCVAELLKESRLGSRSQILLCTHLLTSSLIQSYQYTVGVSGYVSVDFQGYNWNFLRLYQSTEYTISQGLRRMHQSIATKKVSCLPGCCQLLKVCETTCGDQVLINLFGYYPKPTDGLLRQIRATASEDRNHVCLMLSARSNAQTRQALRAHAYTAVPDSVPIFLSQRKRWTLGATSNDLMLVTSRGIQWFERVLAFCNVWTWFLNIFILACLACLIYACFCE